jgi:hypothetical protein
MMDDFVGVDGVGQAELVRRGQVCSVEWVDAAIARIEACNGALNAVVTPAFESAREMAAAAVGGDGPFAGVSFLLKDFGTEWAGVRFTEGSRFPGKYVSPFDQELAARYRRADSCCAVRQDEHLRVRVGGDDGTVEVGRDPQPVGRWSIIERRVGRRGRRRVGADCAWQLLEES